MSAFLEAILAFPTVIFTVTMGFVLLYSALVILGALDLDFLDGVLGIEGAEGAVEGMDGAVESLDGATEGVADGTDDVGSTGLLSGIMSSLGIAGIPITIWGSMLILVSWVLSFVAMDLVGSHLPDGLVGIAARSGIGFGAFLAGGFIGSRLVRPLRRIFITQKAPRRSSLVGRTCTILSSRVDATTGRAEIDDGGAGFLAEVRCEKVNTLTRGSQALVYDYDPVDGIYKIAVMDAILTEIKEAERNAPVIHPTVAGVRRENQERN